MKAAFCILLLALTTCAFSWSRYTPYTSSPNQEQQQKLEELQRRLDQAEFQRQLENEDRERATREAAEERAREASEQAEQTAADLHNAMNRAAVRTKNNFYLGGLMLLMGVFITYIIRNANKEKQMDENQKFGVIVMISSFLLIFLVLMISENWLPQLDYFENLMNTLQLRLIGINTPSDSYSSLLGFSYLIDIPSKYAVLILLTTAAYGLTTYLGITPAIRLSKKTKGE